MRSERSPTDGALGWTPPAVEEIAQLFPQYEILALIAHGGMGAVYRARQIALDREVAIKLLPIEVSGDQSYADRFVREGRAMAKLNHPNIVAVHDFGTTTEGHLFLTMEYIEGATLHHFIHAGNLTLNQSLYIIEQVCDALAYAHSLGIVHRDIKPANVMVDLSLRAKVADFGLARITESSDSQLGITITGQIMGTPNYIAPEQLQALSVDHRADIYSLGVMLYETVAREIPRGIFLPLSQRCGVDLRLDGIVSRAMQQQPERRFQSTAEMKALVTSVRTTRQPAPAPEPKKKRTSLWIGAGAAAAALIGALVFLMQDEPKPTVGPSDEGLKTIAASFPRLESLVFRDSSARTVTAEGLRALVKLPKLKSFIWGSKPLSLEMAAILGTFPALEQLNLRAAGIDETHLAELAKCKTLTSLDLTFGGTSLTPAVIEALRALHGLRELNILTDSKHTPDELATLRGALPKCVIK